MSDADPKLALAAERSHEDSKSANALFQAAGQAAILINGGAATAILAFAAADKAVIRISASALGQALSCFAIGVVLGACLILFQALSVQQYVVRWEGEVLEYGAPSYEKSYQAGMRYGRLSRIAFFLSAGSFLVGAIILSRSLASYVPSSNFATPPTAIYYPAYPTLAPYLISPPSSRAP